MNGTRRLGIALIGVLLLSDVGTLLQASTLTIINEQADFKLDTSFKFKPEMFFGKSITFLNDFDQADRFVYARHTLDGQTTTGYGLNTYGHDVVTFKMALRNRVIWGFPDSIASTTEKAIKLGDSLISPHKHEFNRLVPWIRELWISFDMSEALKLGFKKHHEVTIGAFSFELGRGIALGSAYSVGPDLLGFYTDYAIDQFAFGGKLGGELICDMLTYDLYAAILQNKSSNYSQTGAEIYGQQYGRLHNPQRGFGKINFVFATHTMIHAFNTKPLGHLTIEPYLMYNNDPEQRIQFLGDAAGRLATLGLASEYYGDFVEFGFDYAFNLGDQQVRGWDRNVVVTRNNLSYFREYNSHAVDAKGKLIPFVANSPAEKVIDNADQDAIFNGQPIGTVTQDFGQGVETVTIYNSANRFRNPYKNVFQGWMFVFDGSYWAYKKDLQVAVTAGIASGDENPNHKVIDGTYDGFIGLQEIYSGKRVRSAFVLGGAGKAKRPLSAPTDNQAPERFSSVVSGFSNLVFTGAAASWKPKERDYCLNPNILFYWQEKATHKFDLCTCKDSNQFARNFLGAEINMFANFNMVRGFRGFFIGSIFIPGGHYADIKGKPLNSGQQAALEEFLEIRDIEYGNRTGVVGPIPNIGDDVAFTFNMGVDYVF